MRSRSFVVTCMFVGLLMLGGITVRASFPMPLPEKPKKHRIVHEEQRLCSSIVGLYEDIPTGWTAFNRGNPLVSDFIANYIRVQGGYLEHFCERSGLYTANDFFVGAFTYEPGMRLSDAYLVDLSGITGNRNLQFVAYDPVKLQCTYPTGDRTKMLSTTGSTGASYYLGTRNHHEYEVYFDGVTPETNPYVMHRNSDEERTVAPWPSHAEKAMRDIINSELFWDEMQHEYCESNGFEKISDFGSTRISVGSKHLLKTKVYGVVSVVLISLLLTYLYTRRKNHVT